MAKATKTKTKLKRDIKLPEEILAETKSQRQRHSKNSPDADSLIANKNKSLFAKNLKAIRRANKAHDYGEQASLVVYKAMLDMVLELIPVAEENYRKYKQDRAAYALNTYINQAREITNDMRSMQDFSAQLEIIMQNVRKAFMLVVQNLIDETYGFKKELADVIKSPKSLKQTRDKMDGMVKNHGRFMHESLQMLDSQLTDLLLAPEEQNRMGKKKKSTIVKGGPQ